MITLRRHRRRNIVKRNDDHMNMDVIMDDMNQDRKRRAGLDVREPPGIPHQALQAALPAPRREVRGDLRIDRILLMIRQVEEVEVTRVTTDVADVRAVDEDDRQARKFVRRVQGEGDVTTGGQGAATPLVLTTDWQSSQPLEFSLVRNQRNSWSG